RRYGSSSSGRSIARQPRRNPAQQTTEKVMRAVVQRVTRAKVTVDRELIGEIGSGLVVLVGIARDDKKVEAAYLVDKITNLRIFDDDDGKMNLSVKDIA